MTSPVMAALIAELRNDDEARKELAELLAPLAHHTSRTLTAQEAADVAEVHERTIRRACVAGTLRGTQRGGRWRVEHEDLAAWIAAGAPTRAPHDPPPASARRGNRTTAGVAAIAGTTMRSPR